MITKDNSWFQRKRTYLDKSAQVFIGLGGISVIFAIVLIFFYLLWVVLPMLGSADVSPKAQYEVPIEGKAQYIAVEESGEIGIQVSSTGLIQFFNINNGELINSETIDIADDTEVAYVSELSSEGTRLLLTTSASQLHVIEFNFVVDFDEQGERFLIPKINFPFTEEPLELEDVEGIRHINMQQDEDVVTLTVIDGNDQLLLRRFIVEEDEPLSEIDSESIIETPFSVDYLRMGQLGNWLYLATQDGQVATYDSSDADAPELVESVNLLQPEQKLTQFEVLLGGLSLLVSDDSGQTSQWSIQRDANNNYSLGKVRGFESESNLDAIIPERRRKGLVAITEKGEIKLYHTTANRNLFKEKLIDFTPVSAAISPRASVFLIEAEGNQFYTFHIDNPHPEISWHALWEEVMYEGYTEEQYSWQSSSADNDFEPKFSLMPLTFGTIKAAFYAMLFAVPLAIMGAIYTAYFMSPKMRGLVKPSIEVMEALPTVILGFLAGLWFAPFVEDNLLAIFSMLLVLPLGLIVFAWIWTYLPDRVRALVPDGWQAALLIPVLIFLGYFSLAVAPFFEQVFFDGHLQTWMEVEFGISYDQRNSVVVGIAMGIAVIPTIFSITEDAIFSVPRHLTNGSLALGATPWQTLTRVVILTASPGIFSAVMIGLGRAVGETMIVLMATGNTPVMDMSVFEGMRTLSANIAVELPESEVDSSHYRILFLAALVLFIVTFMFNTAAEVVRQRLRKRYGSL